MQEDVSLYDKWLCNEVYGYLVYQMPSEDNSGDLDDWEELEAVWGFIGDGIRSSGIYDNVGFGFEEALDNNTFQSGTIEVKRHVVTTFAFKED